MRTEIMMSKPLLSEDTAVNLGILDSRLTNDKQVRGIFGFCESHRPGFRISWESTTVFQCRDCRKSPPFEKQ